MLVILKIQGLMLKRSTQLVTSWRLLAIKKVQRFKVDEVYTDTAGNEEATGELDDRTLKGILGISMILISSIVSKLVPAA